EPAFHWLGWDLLLSRGSGGGGGGELLRLDGAIGTQRMNWRAINCLYAGWETLLAGEPPIPAAGEAGLGERGEPTGGGGGEGHARAGGFLPGAGRAARRPFPPPRQLCRFRRQHQSRATARLRH